MHCFVDLPLAHATWAALDLGAVEMVDDSDLVDRESLGDVYDALSRSVSVNDLLPGSRWELAAAPWRRRTGRKWLPRGGACLRYQTINLTSRIVSIAVSP